MKRRLKKNQVVVTALAVMVAVAGYLNYSGMEFGKETATLGKVQEGAADEGAVSTSLIDIPSLDEDVAAWKRQERSAPLPTEWRRRQGMAPEQVILRGKPYLPA